VELARGGPGSVDVIEIDAASHGGVDDARDLRERAFFAPMKSRFKVYIIDEAHMVSSQGFNALLKLVEEPPAHVRFVFATTEPEKVIGTIKSRTHHYPFRLVPPKVLGDYLFDLCRREGVSIEPSVVPLVVRAGGGSVRDSLSVLDQLIGGSGESGVTYRQATALLGYTPDALLDETIDALAAGDGATLFAVVDKVIDAGLDPRRFAEDLLQRLRDLVIASAVPDAASRGLLDVPADSAERLSIQAGQFGRAELTRAADVVSSGLTEMRGATAPRLLLELMCARILLPGVDGNVESLGARLARLERRLSVPDSAGPHPAAPVPQPAGTTSARQPAPSTAPDPADTSDAAGPSGPADATPTGSLSLVDVRQLWPGVLDRVKVMRRFAWMVLSQNASVKDARDGVLTLAFGNDGARKSFLRSGNDEIVRQALIDELGVDWQIETIVDGPTTTVAMPRPSTASRFSSPTGHRPEPSAYPATGAQSAQPGAAEIVSDDDEVLDDSTSSQELLERELGAKVIDDIRHDAV
jgi:DNA polymerase III subunit gamma/tau